MSRLYACVTAVLVAVGMAGCMAILEPAAAVASGTCPNELLRSEQSDQWLPDCRAFELVTPPEKAGTPDLNFAESAVAAGLYLAAGGERAMLGGIPFLGENPSSRGMKAVFARSPEGWRQAASLQPPGAGQTDYVPEVWDPELTTFGVVAFTQQGFGTYSPQETFAVGPAGGPYGALTVEPFSSGGGNARLAAASSDMSHIVLESPNRELAPATAGSLRGARNLYEWSSATGRLAPVNVQSDGSLVNPCGAEVFRAEVGDQGNLFSSFTYRANSMSNDGSTVFFLAPETKEQYAIEGASEDPSCQVPPQLYARVNGSQTIAISAAEPGVVDPAGPQEAIFEGASADGSKVWFLSKAELTADDAGIHSFQLYEYDLAKRRLTRVSRGESSAEQQDVSPEMDISEDGSTVYFRTPAQLTGVVTPSHEGASNVRNIYRYDTKTGALSYVAAAGTSTVGRPGMPMYTDRSGDVLAFSAVEFVGNSSGEALYGPNARSFPGQNEQNFLYDVADKDVRCVSCLPGGAIPEGSSFFPGPGETVYEENFHPISQDGRRVFFQSLAELVPQDTNGFETGIIFFDEARFQDVYEWQAPGGECSSAEGCLSLVSTGTSDQASTFLGASPDGTDVLLLTHSPLVPQDKDAFGDVYDARVDGGIAAPQPPPVCSDESCRLIGAAPPTFGTPQSVAFFGPGNPAPEAGHAVKRKAVKKKHGKRRHGRRRHKDRGRSRSHKARRGRGGAHKATGRGR